MSSESVNKITPVKTTTGDLVSRWEDRALPHSLEFGDAYDANGDCYERTSQTLEWEIPNS